MKHVKIFEDFINESDAKVTAMRAKLNDALDKVIAELKDAYADRDELEAQAEQMEDQDEAGMMMQDIDNHIMMLEGKRDKIKEQLEALKGK